MAPPNTAFAISRWMLIGIQVALASAFHVPTRSGSVSAVTPAGGDMGAHVWGPAFLRDHLLPDLRISGWTPDWYAGFPAYHFYMVVPPLLIVALDAGFTPDQALELVKTIITEMVRGAE